MNYVQEVASVVTAHREELEEDLRAAREDRDHAQATLAAASRRVQTYEALLGLDPEFAASSPEAPNSKVTLQAAMQQVLQNDHDGRMRAGALASEINRLNLYRMRDGRPVEAQQIHARVGHYPDWFTKEGTLIKLINTSSAPQHPDGAK